jgi:hypothetical protein
MHSPTTRDNDLGVLVSDTHPMVTAIALTKVRDQRKSEAIARRVYLDAAREVGADLRRVRELARLRASNAALAVADPPEPPRLCRLLEDQERQLLTESMELVPEESREVLTVFYRADRDAARTADLLGLDETTVRAKLRAQHRSLGPMGIARFEQLVRRTAPSAAWVDGLVREVKTSMVLPRSTAVRKGAAAGAAVGISLLLAFVWVATSMR